MTWLRVFFSRLAALFQHSAAETRISEEIQTHLDLLAADLERRGASPAEARLAARREFGAALHIREIHRGQRALPIFDSLAQDLRYALRQLRANPGFAAAATLTLALGIGANTAIFRVLDAVALRPLPVPHPEQLVVVDAFRGGVNVGFTYPLFREIAASQQALSNFAASADLPLETFEISPGRPVADVSARLVSGDYFAMLAIHPQIGRLLDSADDGPSAAPAAVISDRFWRAMFDASPSVLGRTVRINSAAVVIAGVTPPGFFGETIGSAPDVWAPIALASNMNAPEVASRGSKVISVMGRARSGIAPARAETALAALYTRLDDNYGMQLTGVNGALRIALSSGIQGLRGLRTQFARPLWILMAIVGVVLLTACCNLANLLMARATARTHEIGVRLALGASRRRLFRQLLTESLLLSLLGAAFGLVLAWWGSRRFILLAAAGEPWRIAVDFGWRTLAFTAAVSIAAVCLVGIVPAIAASRFEINSALQASPRGATSGRGRTIFAGSLVVAQISLSLFLVSASLLLVRSFWTLVHQDLGYDPESVLLVNVPLDRPGKALSGSPGKVQTLIERLQSLPAVRSVAADTAGPLSRWQMTMGFSTPSRPSQPGDRARAVFVSGEYFTTLHIPTVAGRTITADDCRARRAVAVLSETAARKLFGPENPVGRLISIGPNFKSGDVLEIVGVVRDVRSLNPRDPAGFLVYQPYVKGVLTAFEIRTSGDPRHLVQPVRRVLEEASGLRSAAVRPLWEAVRSNVGQDRLLAALSASFAILALLLASVGIYGVIAYAAGRRAQEIGIRVALGATRAQISAFLMRGAGALLLAGLLIGAAATLFAARWLRSLLYGIAPHDPAMLSAAALVLAVVALIAAYIPIRRATRLDPTQALRRE